MGFRPIDKNQFALVVESLQQEAQNALAEMPAKRLTADEATRFIGKHLEGNGEYVLLRAIILNEATGGVTISISGRDVLVEHGCLGRHPVPMTRRAIVAVLPSVPETVYVSCSMDE
jgi:hypothetical protein